MFNKRNIVNFCTGSIICLVAFTAIANSEGEEMDLLTLKDIRSKFDSFIEQAKSDPTSGADILTEAYNEARHFLQIAVDFANNNAWSHFFLAVSIWASEKEKEKTLHHLKTAQDFMLNPLNRDMYYQTFLETPEFSDVKDDPEFLKVLGQK